MKLEEATINFFLQCIKEPVVVDALKRGMFSITESNGSSEIAKEVQVNSGVDGEPLIFTKEDGAALDSKITLLLEKQISFEATIARLLSDENNRLALVLKEKEELGEKYKKAEQELEEAKEKSRVLLEKLEDIRTTEKPFQMHMAMWNKLETLSEEKKEYIGQLCGGYSVAACLSLGRDERRIEQLWSYLRDEILKTDSDNYAIEVLREYFEYCLETANSMKENKDSYSFYDVPLGSDYNKETCIRTPDSRQIGHITKVLTRCVKSGESVLYKAMVKVE